jgi:hypothetical protein
MPNALANAGRRNRRLALCSNLQGGQPGQLKGLIVPRVPGVQRVPRVSVQSVHR